MDFPPPALADYAVLYFATDWSAENRTSSHHIARRLSQVMPVLFVETPGSRAPQATGRDFRKLLRKLRAALDPPRKVQENLYVATLPQIPFRRLPMVGTLNVWAGRYLMRRATRRLGFKRLLTWFVVPHPGALAKRFGEKLTVYYCIDDYAAFPGMDAQAIQAADDQLTRTADVVFVASPALVEKKRELNPNAHFSPHGVDYDLFAKASDSSVTPAEGVRSLPHPVIGYFGVLGDWIDHELLIYLAQSRPNWTFLFLGHTAGDVSDLRALPNIVLAGPKPYEELPLWARVFDVAIYPNRLNRQVKHANPLKIREYLASGKPVVSITTPVTSQFAEHLYLADTHEDFLAAIERALREENPERRASRMKSVATMSWDARFRETLGIVAGALKS